MVCTSLTHSEHARTGQTTEISPAAAIEDNLAAYWLALGMNAKGIVHETDALCWEYSGGPYLNRVVGTHLGQHNVDAHIRSVKRTFRNRRAAVTWLIGPSASPDDLGKRLVRHGFTRCEPWQGMAHDLTDLDSLPEHPSHVQIEKVTDEAAKRDWVEVVSNSYDLPAEAKQLLLDSAAHDDQQNHHSWIHYLGRVEGAPVAASTLFVSDGIAGIYLVATVPDARNAGLGTSLTAHALRKARGLGCSMAVLQSAGSAHRIYERLGFRHHCEIEVYRLPAPRPLWKRIASKIIRAPLRRWSLSNGRAASQARIPSRGAPADGQSIASVKQ